MLSHHIFQTKTGEVKPIIVKIIIPLSLLCLWAILTLDYISKNDFGVFSLVSFSRYESLLFTKSNNLQKNDRVRGELIAEHQNLSVISVGFLTHERVNHDKLEFRIKEENAKDWYYKESFDTSKFLPGGRFFFRFPAIKDSRWKKYQFEIESLSGQVSQSVSINPSNPTVINYYVFSKTELVGDPKSAFHFLKNKIDYLFKDKMFLYFFSIYSLPFVFYLSLFIRGVNYKMPIILLSLLMANDIRLRNIYSDLIYAAIFFAGIILLLKYKIDSVVLAPQVAILIAIMTIAAITNQYILVEKIASWVYVSLAIVASHRIISGYMSISSEIYLSQFITDFRVSLQKLTAGTYFMMSKNIPVRPVTPSEIRFQAGTTFKSRFARQIKSTAAIIVWIPLIYYLVAIVKNLFSYQKVFLDHYPVNQVNIFTTKTGVYLVALYIASSFLFLVVSRIMNKIKQPVIALMIILGVIRFQDIIYNRTTGFKNQPIVWSARGNNTTEAWVDVFVTGRNLRDLPFKGKVFIDGVEQRIIRWSDKEVVFRTDPTITKSGKIEVVTHDGKKTNSLDYNYEGDR